MKTFAGRGCIACRSGPFFSNFSLKKFEIEGGKHHDGRYKVIKEESDRYKYKVSSLLNMAMTPPYTHAGVIKSLPEMVEIMGTSMLNMQLA